MALIPREPLALHSGPLQQEALTDQSQRVSSSGDQDDARQGIWWRCQQRLLWSWQRFAYPAVLFCVGVLRRGTVTGFVFTLLALAIVACGDASAVSGQMVPRWRQRVRECAPLASIAFTGGLFLAAGVLEALCALKGDICSSDTTALLFCWWRVGFSGDWKEGFGSTGDRSCCKAPLSVVPEAVAFAAALASWLAGLVLLWPLRDGAEPWTPPCGVPLTRWPSMLALMLLLMICASLDWNAFSAAYYLAALAAIWGLSASSGADCCPRPVAAGLRVFLSLVAIVHAFALAVFSAAPIAGLLPQSALLVLCPGPDSNKDLAAHLLQASGAFLLLELLAWCPSWSIPSPTPPALILPVVSPPVPRPSLRAESAASVSHLELSLLESGSEQEEQAASAPSHDVAGDSEPSAEEPCRTPQVSSCRPHSSRSFARQTSVSSSFARPLLHRAPTAPASFTLSNVASAFSTSAGVARDAAKSAAAETRAILHDMVIGFSSSSLPPLASVLALAFLTPSLVSLLLMALGFILMYRPPGSPPVLLLRLVLAFVLAFGATNYVYTVLGSMEQWPVSHVPSSFTTLEQIGLQRLARKTLLPEVWMSTVFQQLSLVAAHMAAFALLAMGIRCARTQTTSLDAVLGDVASFRSAFFGIAGWCVRLASLVATLAVAMSGVPNWIGLGYVMWFVFLAVGSLCVSPTGVDWVLLFGGQAAWRTLLFYSQGVTLVQYCWQIFEHADDVSIGLKHSSNIFEYGAWRHVAVAWLAAISAWTLQARQAEAPLALGFLKPSAILTFLVTRIGVLVEMGLVFQLVLLAPPCLDGIIYLALFIAIVAVEQFGINPIWRASLLAVNVIYTACLLPLRYAAQVPELQSWLVAKLHDADPQMWWDVLKLEASGDIQTRIQFMGALLLYASTLYRVRWHWLASLADVDAGQQPGLPRILETCLVMVVRWSYYGLVMCAFFLMLKREAILHFQFVGVIWLFLGRRLLHHVGALISTLTGAALLAQYVCRLRIVRLPADQIEYWGFDWKADLTRNEVLLLLLGIAQGSLHRTARTCVFRVRGDGWAIPAPVLAHSAHIASALMLLAFCCWNSLPALPLAILIAIFTVSPASSEGLPSRIANRWLTAMAYLLTLVFLQGWLMQVWLPPGILPRPDYSSMISWGLCDMFDGVHLVTPAGASCSPRSIRDDCVTQRERCGVEWMAWTGFRGYPGLTTLPMFLCLFSCGILREANKPIMRSIARSMSFLGTASGTEIGAEVGAETATNDGEASQVFLLSRPQECIRKFMTSLLWSTNVCRLTAVLMWASLAGTSMSSMTNMNVASLTYILLLFVHLRCFFGGKAFEQRARIVQSIRRFNIAVIMLHALYMCPLMPCPFGLDIESPDGERQSTTFVTSAQCMDITSSYANGIADEQVATSWLSLFLACLGLTKQHSTFNITAKEFSQFAIYATSLAHSLACMAWRVELAQELAEAEARIQSRANWYVRYLADWRHSEISMRNTRRNVLLEKLRLLTSDLNKLKGDPRGRDACDERERSHRSRVLDICLQSGFRYEKVEAVLEDFDAAARAGDGPEEDSAELPQTIAQARSRDDPHLIKFVDRAVLEDLHNEEEWHKHVITFHEAAERKDALRRSCREFAAGIATAGATEASEKELAPDEAAPPATSSGTGSECPIGSGAGMAVTGGDKSPSDVAAGATGSNAADGGEAAGTAQPEAPSMAATVAGHSESFLRRRCKACIDDLLFVSESDETLSEHRKHDGLPRLLQKALMSQTRMLLLIAAVLQFASCTSLLDMVTISALVLSYMAFPHAPASLWKFLQMYNIMLLMAKMMFQLALVCQHGFVTLSGCPEPHGLPWVAVLGLLKVKDKVQGPESIAPLSSLLAYVWANFLVCVLLYAHFHVLSEGGRLGDPRQICAVLESGDSHPEAGAAESPQSDQVVEEAPAANRMRRWVTSIRATSRHVADSTLHGSSELHKPSVDLYSIRFSLGLACVSALMVLWGPIVGSGESFQASLAQNSFSGGQVLGVSAFILLMLVDRALYTWYTQDMSFAPSDTGTTRSNSGSTSSSESSAPPSAPRRVSIRKSAVTTQKFLLLIQLVVLHSLCIARWINQVNSGVYNVSVSMLDSPVLCGFYALYIAFLVTSSLQLKYDVNKVRGGLRILNTTDMSNVLLLKVYTLVPFIDELRVLVDWTVTRTSLQFFMWMKIEDARVNLYRVRCDMEWRQESEPLRGPPYVAARPAREKFLQGGLFLLGIFVLIVGPLIYFSSLNVFLQPNLVVSGTLTAGLQVQLSTGDMSLSFYTSSQLTVRPPSDELTAMFGASHPDITTPLTVQAVSFPHSSDTFWMVSSDLRRRMARYMVENPKQCYFYLSYSFLRAGSSTPAARVERSLLNSTDVNVFIKMLNTTSSSGTESTSISLPKFLEPEIMLDQGTAEVKKLPSQGSTSGVIVDYHSTSDALPYWSVASDGRSCDFSGGQRPPCEISFLVASQRGVPGNEGSTGGSFTITGIYIGVVYTIGRLLRSAFQNSSQRIIWEEMPETELLLDLCNGIYIARINGLVTLEYKLYYELIRIYRNPELLGVVSRPKGSSSFPFALDDANAALSDSVLRRRGSGTPGGAVTNAPGRS